MFVIDEVGFGF